MVRFDPIVPNSFYGASQIAQVGGSSPPEQFSTGLWADVVPTIGVVNVPDFAAVKDWLVELAGAPCKSRAWMRSPPNPFADVNVLDRSLAANVLAGDPDYSGPPISTCP